MKTHLIQRKLLNAEDIAEILGLTVQTVYNKCAKNAKHPLPVKPLRVGRKLRFRLTDVEKYIESL